MKKRLERRSLLLLFLLLIFCVAASIQINEKAKKNRLNLKTGSTEEFRKLGMEEAFFQVLAKTDHEKRGRLYAIYFLENSLFPQDNEKELFEKWSEKEEWKSFEQLFGMISAIFLFRNHRNIHSIRYLLWTAGWESAPTEEKGDMKAVI